ncbi:molybdate ABC transporter substrate-binding protein [Alteromonas sp. BL110]|uniref:molybdate ABC transporter substrate-binding protein n=1 Tax=Alteromonas sp. BL110 TaxID=1714845 RepID=UPI000E527F7E|nr:molybdate ABC transporter substrate-binding protein [Alteromonas sp. BL110]AXT40078.1 molybdate ABC transporter substrate-binding protein [Alteromonas sp. BL110]RKM79309.1 molybdate ABC transporter substrate-binding protein [Alteromonas sp. BL110]
MFFSLAMRLSSFVNLAMLILVSVSASASPSVAPGVMAFSSSAVHATGFEPVNAFTSESSDSDVGEQSGSVVFKRDEKINVAVAANFAKPLKSIAKQFTELTGIEVAVTVSSSGTLYAQIQHGASFDVFLSADRARPQALVDNNVVHHGNLVDYAKGKLAFVYTGDLSSEASHEASSERNCKEIAGSSTEDTAAQLNVQLTDCLSKQLVQLMENPQNKVAIANPKLAPYGDAAQQALQNLSLWQQFLPHRVMGKNVLQTLQFYTTGSVKGAFVAYSLALDLPSNFATTGNTKIADSTTVIVPVPETLYQPIVQSLVVNSKTAASLLPNLFEPRPIKNAIAPVNEPAHKDDVETTRAFNLADANGVSSPSLFVQYLMSQGVQHSLIEWGYEPTIASGVGI